MGPHKNVSILALSLVALGTSAVHAADLDPSYGIIPPSQEERVEFGSGWYVRGDIGLNRGMGVRAGDEPYDTSPYTAVPGVAAVPGVDAVPATTVVTAGTVTTNKVTNPDGSVTTSTTTTTSPTQGTTGSAAIPAKAAIPAQQFQKGVFTGPGSASPNLQTTSGTLNYTGSLGGGYQFNRWFRADVIFDFHQPVQNSRQGQGVNCVTATVKAVDPTGGAGLYEVPYGTTCTPTLKATLRSYDTLVNGYIDLGTWHSITPYIGAGIGLSFGHATTSSNYIQGNGASYNVTYADALSGTAANQYWDRSQSRQYYNLAFAFMAGISIDVFDHTKFDIGYRYLHLGSVFGTNLATQEVRGGLRYMIDN